MIPLPDDSTNPALAAEYAAARAREGRVMAILRAMGPRATVVRAFVALSDAVLYGPAALSLRERELLSVTTAEANGAEYSLTVHAGMLAELGGDSGSERDQALVAFARAANASPGAGSLPEALFSTEERSDALLVVSLLNFANRMAMGTGITPSDDLA